MNLAIVLRGIFYNDLRDKENVPGNNLKSNYTDYRTCLPLFRDNLLSELYKVFDNIDIYIVTYENDMLEQIIMDYDVKDKIIYEKERMFGEFTMERLSEIMIDGLELFQKNNSNNYYSHCLLTRPDLYFYRKFNINKLDLGKINFGWTHDGNHSCDNFILFNSELSDRVIKSLLEDKYPHTLQRHFDKKEMNFISRDIHPHTDKIQPDFYIVLRYLDQFRRGELIVDEWRN
jgi:hypothetical protein